MKTAVSLVLLLFVLFVGVQLIQAQEGEQPPKEKYLLAPDLEGETTNTLKFSVEGKVIEKAYDSGGMTVKRQGGGPGLGRIRGGRPVVDEERKLETKHDRKYAEKTLKYDEQEKIHKVERKYTTAKDGEEKSPLDGKKLTIENNKGTITVEEVKPEKPEGEQETEEIPDSVKKTLSPGNPFNCFLPGKEIAKGESWEVKAKELEPFFKRFFPELPAQKHALAKCTLREAVNKEGKKCARILVELEVEVTHKVKAKSAEIEVKKKMELEGTVWFNLSAKKISDVELEGEMSYKGELDKKPLWATLKAEAELTLELKTQWE